MEKKKYTAAIFEYKKLLSCEDAKHTERVLYGNIYHNLATAYAQLFLFDIAADLYIVGFSGKMGTENHCGLVYMPISSIITPQEYAGLSGNMVLRSRK